LELHRLRDEDDRAREEERRRFDARLAASARLSRLEKVHEKIRSKELRLVEQGLRELESEERDSSPKDPETVLHSPVVGSLTALRSLSANSFFNPSFSLLLNLISSNTP